MQIRKPDYFDRFQCLASQCSDNCCIGWEIDIDSETAERYSQITGSFGERLKVSAMLEAGEEAAPHFILNGERCPFLNRENLCDIITELGEESLCGICREHPRFYEWFDRLTEAGLGLCCEEAARLILEPPERDRFVTIDQEEKNNVNETEREKDPLFGVLFHARETAFAILGDREMTVEERLKIILMYAEDIQDYLDLYAEAHSAAHVEADFGTGRKRQEKDAVDGIGEVDAQYADPAFRTGLLDGEEMQTEQAGQRKQEVIKEILHFLVRLEPISEEWPARLKRMEAGIPQLLEKREKLIQNYREREYEYEHLAVYFTYRYFLKSYFDCDVLSRARFTAVSILMIQLMAAESGGGEQPLSLKQQAEIAKDYSKEMEYSEENMDAFSAEVWKNEAFSTESLTLVL